MGKGPGQGPGRPANAGKLEEDDEETELAGYLSGLGGSEITIKLFRYDKQQRAFFVDVIPLEVATSGSLEAHIRDNFGGGSYLIRCIGAGGKFLKGANKTIHVESPEPSAQQLAQGGQPGAPDSSYRMVELQMTMMRDASDRQMQMMQGFNTSMMGILTAVISGNKAMDPIALISLLKESSNPASSLEMIKSVIGLSKELGVGGGGGAEADPMMQVLTAALPKLLESRAPQQQQQALPPAGQQQQQQEPARMENPEMDERLRFLKLLKTKAKAGKDVNDWADYIDANTDEPGPAWILGIIQQFPFEAVWGGLVQADRELGEEPYKTWFKNLYDELMKPGEETEGGLNLDTEK